MEELIRQILLLSPDERKKISNLIQASLNDFGEGYLYSTEDFSSDQKDVIQQRWKDIENEKECLIELDDHLLSIK